MDSGHIILVKGILVVLLSSALGNAVAQDSNEVYMPIGVRIGKVIPSKISGSWNAYFEWQTSLIYNDWPGAAKDNSIRFNLTKTLPVGF